ncbi:MAG: hypothetical protein M3P33_02020 [bacterium]|nr:hypothetical protein [bacterium]
MLKKSFVVAICLTLVTLSGCTEGKTVKTNPSDLQNADAAATPVVTPSLQPLNTNTPEGEMAELDNMSKELGTDNFLDTKVGE